MEKFNHFQMIENFKLKIEDLRSASGGSIIKKRSDKIAERSDILKYSFFNIQSSI